MFPPPSSKTDVLTPLVKPLLFALQHDISGISNLVVETDERHNSPRSAQPRDIPQQECSASFRAPANSKRSSILHPNQENFRGHSFARAIRKKKNSSVSLALQNKHARKEIRRTRKSSREELSTGHKRLPRKLQPVPWDEN